MARGYPDWEGGKSGLYLKPEWAAFEGEDQTFWGDIVPQPFGGSINFLYNVPADRTLYLNFMAFASFAGAAADADKDQMCTGYVEEVTTAVFMAVEGGNSGGMILFPKPIVIPGGHQLRLWCYNRANHNCSLILSAGGYLV